MASEFDLLVPQSAKRYRLITKELALERFWSKVDKLGTQTEFISTICWDWIAGCNTDGYGLFILNGKQFVAHRLSYELIYDKVPKGMELDHLCHNPKCVRPSHLEVVTHQENVSRGIKLCGPRLICKNGHLITGDNEYIFPKSGKRCCRICQNRRSKLWQENHKCLSL